VIAVELVGRALAAMREHTVLTTFLVVVLSGIIVQTYGQILGRWLNQTLGRPRRSR
jgi:hypothetical protein